MDLQVRHIIVVADLIGCTIYAPAQNQMDYPIFSGLTCNAGIV